MLTKQSPLITDSDFRKDISYHKEQERKLKNKLFKEEKKVEEKLLLIENFINRNQELDIEQLIESIISKGWITKGNLTKSQLYENTKDLVEDYLVIEAEEE